MNWPSILLALVVAILSGWLGFYINRSSKLSERIVRSAAVAIPTIFLFLLFIGQRDQTRGFVMEVRQALDQNRSDMTTLMNSQNKKIEDLARAFTFEVVEGADVCERVITAIAQGAEEYIYATGSVSRSHPYLEAIEDGLKRSGEMLYKRVMWGDRFSGAFREHVDSIQDMLPEVRARAHFYYCARTSGAYMVMSEKELFIMLPGRRRAGLDMGLRTTNLRRLQEYYQYFNDELVTDAAEVQPPSELFGSYLRNED